jgi:glutamate racemase
MEKREAVITPPPAAGDSSNPPPRCIGVFDSGVGGLSVLTALRRHMPDAPFCYVADSSHNPYGPKPPEQIRERCLMLAEGLVARGADMLVVACNTATAVAIDALRGRLEIPVIGMEPAVKPAAAATRNGIVGVLATDGTLASARFAALLDRFAHGIRVHVLPCPDLVELVERGELDGNHARQRVERRVAALQRLGADTLVLGCTHFPLLRPLIEAAAGPECAVIDTADAVARQTLRRRPPGLVGGGLELYSTGHPERLQRVARAVLGADPTVHAWPPAGMPTSRRDGVESV